MRLLICEDDPPMVELMTRFMQPMCSLIDSTDSLHDALDMARTKAYNIVLLDLRLRLTGEDEALAAIRALKSFNLVVVVVSGVMKPDIEQRVMAAGADSYIRKGPDMNSHKLLVAANIAVLHLPKESFKSDSFYDHTMMLKRMVEAA